MDFNVFVGESSRRKWKHTNMDTLCERNFFFRSHINIKYINAKNDSKCLP